MILLLFSVPSPGVEVIMLQPEPYLAGMLAEMRCSISLDDSVDSEVDVEVLWLQDGVELHETVRIKPLAARLVENSHYQSSLQFSTLSSTSDNGNYMCLSTVYPTENKNYISNGTEGASLSLSLTGSY